MFFYLEGKFHLVKAGTHVYSYVKRYLQVLFVSSLVHSSLNNMSEENRVGCPLKIDRFDN